MQLRTFSAFALYVGSYLPLAIILLAQDIDISTLKAGFCSLPAWREGDCRLPLLHPAWSLSTVGFSAACLLLTLWALKVIKCQNRVQITEAKHIPADLINYVIPYVVSFMGIGFDSSANTIGFSVFFIWMFWITYKSGQIIMNPVLISFGWRLYDIKYHYLQSDDCLSGAVLSQVEIEPNSVYHQAYLQDVMIVREQK